MKNMNKLVLLIVFFTLLAASGLAEIMISEIMYDPAGTDSKKEWIELYNAGHESVNISGWKIVDSSIRNIEIVTGSEIIDSHFFVVLARNTTDFANEYPLYAGTIFSSTFTLNNGGAMIYLKNKDNVTIDFLNYTDIAEKGYTIEINDSSLDNSNMLNWRQGIFKGNPGQIQTSSEEFPEDKNTVPEFGFFSSVLAIISVGAIYVFGRNK